jgi:hypothetical protein
VELIHVKDLFALTGYVRGGCTAIGMKKAFVTRIDSFGGKTGGDLCQCRKGGRADPACLAAGPGAQPRNAEFADLTDAGENRRAIRH